jgi:uncharacterized phage protein gp47/JayE
VAFTLPTFRQILTRVETDLGQFSDGTVPRRSVEFVLARAIAGVSRGLYGFLTYIFKQAFADTADETNFWHWFDVFGLTRKVAVAWAGTYEFTGVDGTDVPDLTQVQRSDGALYETDGLVTIASGTATAVLRAVVAGEDSNCDDAQALSLALPITDIDPEGEVQSTTTSGSDLETLDDAKARLLAYLKTPPSGGGPGDYVTWALEVPGFTRAWEFANLLGPNSVAVAAVRDEDGTGSAIVPDAGERATLLAHLEEEAPITVTVSVITLTAVPLDITLTSLNPDNADVREAIVEALTDFLEREAEPGATLALSRINEAISSATGEIDHVMSVPAADVVYTTSQIGVMGTLT